MKGKKLLEKVYKEFLLERPDERRRILVDKMNELSLRGVNCFNCTGLCCTSISNSMQTDPVQTLELYCLLEEEGRLTDELEYRLKENIDKYRLDYDISTGGWTLFRRTYTCPFYAEGPKGCSISPESKPYGCLSFNASTSMVAKGEDCSLDKELLEERENLFIEKENLSNTYLKQELSLWWDKRPMPVALLEIIKKLQ